MTIGLSYESTLSRVQIALSDLPDGAVRVERSINQLLWETVRGGVALPVVSGTAALDDYEFVTDVENFYRVVPVDPPAGLLLDGTSGSYASTPDTAALDITGDLDLRVDATADDWTAIGTRVLVGKYNTGTSQRSYRLVIFDGGILRFQFSTAGTSGITRDATVALPVTSGRIGLRVTLDVNNGASGHTVQFWTVDRLGEGLPFNKLGDDVVTAGTTSIHAGTAPLEVGASNGGTLDRFTGTIHRAEVYNGISGTVVANPVFEDQPAGTTSFTDGAGNLWTINGTASVVGIEQDSITPSLAGQVWLKSIRFSFLNQVVRVADYSDIDRPGRIGVFPVTGRSTPIAVTDVRGSRAWSIDLITETNDEDRTLELSIMASGTWFLHVPTTTGNALLPGSMYAVAGQVRKHRIGGVSDLNRYTLELVEVAPPGPDVVGTTMTWGTVANLYGSWGALLAANPTWGDLLSTVGSPEDLVVL